MELLDLEMGIIAMMYLDKDLVWVKLDKLDRELFALNCNKVLFDKMLKYRKDNNPCDFMLLRNGSGFTLEEFEQIHLYTGVCPSVNNFETFYNNLLVVYNERKARELGENKITFEEYNEAISKYHKIDREIKIFNTKKDMVQLTDDIEKLISGDYKIFKLGIQELDDILGDILSGTMVVISAKTSIGKTWLMLQIAYNLAERGVKVLYLSCEMGKTKLLKRIIQGLTGIRLRAGSKKELEKSGDYKRITNSLTEISKTDLTIAEMSQFDEKLINGLIRQSGASVVFIDYIQQFNLTVKTDTRAATLSDIANGIKRMSQRHDLLVFAGSQQNRGGEDGDLDSIKESSGIAESCDVAIMLEKHPNTFSKEKNQVGYTFHISKNRDGNTGDVELAFSYTVGKFTPKTTIII